MPDDVKDREALATAVLKSLNRRVRTKGEISLPAAPTLLDLYVRRLALLFASMGKPLSKEKLQYLRSLIEPLLREGFEISPHCRVIVSWESEPRPGPGVDYIVRLERGTVAEQFQRWAETCTLPLFGIYPDAKVLDVASTLGAAGDAPILDVGAGTGRNSLPLARLGHPVDALDVTDALVKTIGEAADAEGLRVTPILGDVVDAKFDLEPGRYGLIVVAEVCSHFRGNDQMHLLFERCARWLRSDGLLLLNAFVAEDGYEPDQFTREMAQITWSTMYTRSDLAEALRCVPLRLVSDEPVYSYEKIRQPASRWPPTGWFEDWAQGYNLFELQNDQPPVRLRWLLYQALPG